MQEAIAALLEEKANTEHVFTDDEAAMDLFLNCQEMSQSAIGKRWNWHQSTVSRRRKNLLEKAVQYFGQRQEAALPLHNPASSNPQNDTVKADFDESLHNAALPLHKNNNPRHNEKERFLSPHTPLSSKENTPSKERKDPLKGVQKKENFPHETGQIAVGGDGSLIPVEIFVEPVETKPKDDHCAPFTIEQAEEYFRSRFESGEAGRAAAAAGYTAAGLADKFFWHWHARGFEPETGNPITENNWKRRASTWWAQKERYEPNPIPVGSRKQKWGGEPELGRMF